MFITSEEMIKEYCPYAKTAVLRSTHYGSDFERFVCFVNQAQKDFPAMRLDFKDFTVVKYGGDRYAKTFGIEFVVDEAPEEYTVIAQLEYTA